MARNGFIISFLLNSIWNNLKIGNFMKKLKRIFKSSLKWVSENTGLDMSLLSAEFLLYLFNRPSVKNCDKWMHVPQTSHF